MVEVSDATYMDAVAKGDMKTAQRMVDAAAKEAGLKKKNLVRTLFTPREVDEIRPRAIEAVRSVAEGYVFNMDDSMDEEERWSNVGFDSNKLGFKTSGDDSYSIKIDYVNDTDDWLKIVETNNGKKSLLDYSLRPVEYKVPSDPVTYDDSGNVIPLSQRFNRRSEDIRNPMKTNPMDPRSAMTQIEGTKKTYAKAAKMLTGKVIDYGAGLGIGTDILRAEGLSVDSFEPYPEKWKGKRPPTFTDSAKIPSASYDSLVSFSVINVVEPDMRKFLFQEVDRILRPNGVALITGRSRSDVEKSTTKIPHLEEGGYLIDEGDEQRYQKGFTQAELERYAKEVLGPGFTVQKNGSLNGASIKISKGKTNPVTRSMIRTKLSRILEPGDRVLDYDRAQGEDLYRLWDMVHTDKPLTKEALTEIEGLLDDDGVLVIQSGEEPSGLQDHFRKATRYQGMLLVQGPMNPEEARINTEKLRRDLE